MTVNEYVERKPTFSLLVKVPSSETTTSMRFSQKAANRTVV